MFNAIQHCFGYDVCLKSKLADVDQKDALVARAKRRSAAGYGTELFFLITKGERHEFNRKEMRNVNHAGLLINSIRKVDDLLSKF